MLTFVLERSRRLNFVAFQPHVTHLFFEADAHPLLALPGLPRVTNDVVLEDQAACLAANANTRGCLHYAVVLDEIALQGVAMACHAFALVTEINALLVIAAHLIIPQQIIGILLAD